MVAEESHGFACVPRRTSETNKEQEFCYCADGAISIIIHPRSRPEVRAGEKFTQEGSSNMRRTLPTLWLDAKERELRNRAGES